MAINIAEIAAVTAEGYSRVIADNMTNHNALLRLIDSKGNKKVATGRTILQELEYQSHNAAVWYTGTDTLSLTTQQAFTAAEYAYKQLNANVVINGLEEIQNSGREAIHNLLSARLRNVDKTLTNAVGSGVYADGTGTSGKEMGGLQLLVADDPDAATPVGGFTPNTETWWQNKLYDFTAETVTPGSTTIQTAMNSIWTDLIRGTDKPDICTADKNYWIFYLESLQVNQRFTDDTGAGAGFTNVTFMGSCPVIYDDQCPADHMYMLNSNYIFLRPAMGRDFKMLPDKSAVDQDRVVIPMVWAGNMTMSNRSLQGVITAI